ncbi:MAG: hypothetical protein ACLTHX_12895 [Blautia massiliensis (ex Durand et al. 2017)]|uniref:hypothetical protein n=1 Tax=Blautia massiliensis (ex Durand et al. 2017) TaxID=1737424 RepID=UPI003995F8A8
MGRKVDFYNGKETIIPGKVINLSDQGEIIVMTEDNLCIVKENGAIVKIGSVKNTIFNANETNGVSWLNDNGGKLQFCWYSNNGKIQTSHSLKSECVWSYILKMDIDIITSQIIGCLIFYGYIKAVNFQFHLL